MLLDSSGASVNVKQASAVITLLREVTSLGSKCQIGVVDQIGGGCMRSKG